MQVLAIEVMVERVGANLVFDVYRKPCCTERLITSDSNHDFSHKVAAFHSMADRLVSIPMSDDKYEAEVKKMIRMGEVNGYPRSTIINIINKHKRKKENLEFSTFFGMKNTDEEIKRRSVIFYPKVTRTLRRVYKEQGLELVHRNGNSLRQQLGSIKDPTPDLEKSGIYKINCEIMCLFKYLGMTEREIQVRFDDHLGYIRRNEYHRCVARHVMDSGHTIGENNVELVQEVFDTRKIEEIEAIHIYKNKHKPMMNGNLGMVRSPLLALFENNVK